MFSTAIHLKATSAQVKEVVESSVKVDQPLGAKLILGSLWLVLHDPNGGNASHESKGFVVLRCRAAVPFQSGF